MDWRTAAMVGASIGCVGCGSVAPQAVSTPSALAPQDNTTGPSKPRASSSPDSRCPGSLLSLVTAARRVAPTHADELAGCSAQQHGKLWMFTLQTGSGAQHVVVDGDSARPLAWGSVDRDESACGVDVPKASGVDPFVARAIALSCLELTFGTKPSDDYPIEIQRHGGLWLAEYHHPTPLPSHTTDWLVINAADGAVVGRGHR